MMEDPTNNEARQLTLHEKAPQFEAITTHGMKRLSDFEGKWVVMFSHPASFSPVCSIELVAFAHLYEDFKKLNTELIGLSIDSIYSHIAWTRSINENFGVNIQFPIIEDLKMSISKSYGMVHPKSSDNSTVRATFIIDPKGIIRALSYYPNSVGRSVSEILRLITALQKSDDDGVITPEGWRIGECCIVPPPRTITEANKRLADSRYDVKNWYFAKTKNYKNKHIAH